MKTTIKKPTWTKLDECPQEYQSMVNLDEGESIFFARELEHIKSKSYDIKFKVLKARRLFPLEFEAHAGSETITYEQYDQVGVAKIVSNYADDLPRVDVQGNEFTSKVRTISSAYGYNYDEIQSAARAGKSIKEKKAMAAKRAQMTLENRIAFFGDEEHNIQGFFNNPNYQEVVLAADGTGGSTKFADKDADQIIRDVVALPTAVHDLTCGVEYSDIVLMPVFQYNLITNRRIPDTGMTVMEFILAKNEHINHIEWVNECRGSGAGGTDKMITYRRDPEVLTMEIPSDYKQLSVQEKNLEYIIPVHQRFGGVIVYYPLAIAFSDGI